MKGLPYLKNLRKDQINYVPPKLNEHLYMLGAPHIDSFNEMLHFGLSECAKRMLPEQFETSIGERVKLYIKDIKVSTPCAPLGTLNVKDSNIYPTEARQAHETYSATCIVTIGWSVNGLEKPFIDVEVGKIPIMVKSDACNLSSLNPKQMISKGEHASEWGGYFIIKGNEKIIRMLLITRRNFPIAIKRSSWKNRGKLFSDFGVFIRSVRDDQVSSNNCLHYLNNGTAKCSFFNNKSCAYVPVCLFLKCLVNFTDEEIYKRLIRGFEHDQYFVSCVQNMLRDLHVEGLHTQNACKHYLGDIFRSKVPELPNWVDASEITDFILNERVLIHVDKHEDKFNLLIFMTQKLFQLAQGKCKVENIDSIMMQEVLLGGHLYQKYLNERLQMWLQFCKRLLSKKFEGSIISDIRSLLKSSGIGKTMESFLATGNVSTNSGMGLMENSGLTIIAENINRMRFMSHFRAVHRGSFFTKMRTTEARQLLPDAWGFICPVHTPDGTPCGLLNHLTVACKISKTTDAKIIKTIPKTLVNMGMIPLESPAFDATSKTFIVMLEGKIIGYIRQADATHIVNGIRSLKLNGTFPEMMEIAFVPFRKNGQFPGLFLFIGPARMMRPVKNMALKKVEYIGSLEQVYMDIAIDAKEAYPDITTHMEISKTDFLSNLANLIPMPDYNQSPRNMYQCQMGKQTMGTPCLNWPKQSCTKLYRLQTPATPFFRTVHYDKLDLDDFGMGLNAIIAVISYTGYDMEDAMIINKSAHERGFGYGTIYKTRFIELTGSSYFARDPHNPNLVKYLDNDGLPHPGSKLCYKNPLYCYFDTNEYKYKCLMVEEKEESYVDSVKYIGTHNDNSPQIVSITIRIARPSSIGDKFASRAGQKGICSQKYPAEDLPFSETGLIPDIVFNPHGFPSRMTIAMMIETMAGKSAALHGLVHDATPFRFTEENTAIDHFGQLLEIGGYNYYGTERLYSGVDGREMTADIFFGIVHYQRLRHMVSDKWQVRSTGPVDALTRQPIQGRKRGGGVRFGEMERDGLISHGASYILQDRLFHNSDKTHTLVCSKCGSILAPMKQIVTRSEKGNLQSVPDTCRLCGDGSAVETIEIPYAYKYLVTELSSVNINARFKLCTI